MQGCSNTSCCWSQFMKSLRSSGFCIQAIVAWKPTTCKHWQVTDRGSSIKLKAKFWWKCFCIISASWAFSSLPQDSTAVQVDSMLLFALWNRLLSTAVQTWHLCFCTLLTHIPWPFRLTWPKCLLPTFLFIHPERKELALYETVSALTHDIFCTNASYSKICLFRKALLNNLVEMSDTSRPIYHNELQMPRMDNNGLFIRRQEQRRQEGSIYSLPPMAHSSFSL